MIEKHLIDYLVENTNKDTSNKIDLMRYNLGSKIYGYGDQFIGNSTKNNWLYSLLRAQLEFVLIKFFRKKNTNKGTKILSSAYSTWNLELEKLGYDVYNPAWNFRRNFKIETSSKLFRLTKEIERSFKFKSFRYLISPHFLSLLDKYTELFKEQCIKNEYKALILPQDVGFFEKTAINVFKDLGLPTIFWAHGGMPNRYDSEMGNRTDYSVQWGEKQIEAFIQNGYDSSKFFACGHPSYNNVPTSLRFELDNVLVLTKGLTGVSPQREPVLEDRGNAIMYLNSIQHVLSCLGVKNAYLRPHPSENISWYSEFIDTEFFIVEESSFSDLLNKAGLVIGPVSTSLIDAMYHSVNYLIYEPLIEGRNIYNRPLSLPLDGSDSRIPMANSEEDLERLIRERVSIPVEVYKEFVTTPRNLDFIKDIL